MSKGTSTSTAILIGSAIIAVGVFLGLGRLQPQPAPQPVAPAVVAPPAPPPVTPRETVAQQAREALQYQHSKLRASCPVPAGQRHEFVLDVTFDAQGAEVMRGITERQQNPAPGIGGCVSGAITPLRVPAPGAQTMVEVPLSLP